MLLEVTCAAAEIINKGIAINAKLQRRSRHQLGKPKRSLGRSYGGLVAAFLHDQCVEEPDRQTRFARGAMDEREQYASARLGSAAEREAGPIHMPRTK